jgi:hypothetical protein
MGASSWSVAIASLSLAVSGITMWLTLFQRGRIRMTQPTVAYFGPDGGGQGEPKVFLRTLLYSTSRRGQIVESMFVRVRRGESSQTFNVWVYGDGRLARGSGVYVGHDGVACNHHFMIPRDGTRYEFLAGEYDVEVYASTVPGRRAILLHRFQVSLSQELAAALKDPEAGVYFDWGPDSARYHAHVEKRPKASDPIDLLMGKLA